MRPALRPQVVLDEVLGAYLTLVEVPDSWPERVYLTRDVGRDGKLSPIVEVWSARPTYMRDALDDGSPGPAVCWHAHVDGESALLGRYPHHAVRHWARVAPDTGLECVGLPCR